MTIQPLLSRGHILLRVRTLRRMLYETAARAAEILSLDVADRRGHPAGVGVAAVRDTSGYGLVKRGAHGR